MVNNSFENNKWLKALSLNERIQIWRHFNENVFDNQLLAEKNWEKWRNQPPFREKELFNQRLSSDDLNESLFRRVLGFTPVELQEDLFHPHWLKDIERAFSRYSKKNAAQTIVQNGVEALFAPLINEGKNKFTKKLKRLIQKYPLIPLKAEKIQEIFFNKLLQDLVMMANKTLALEVNVARLKDELIGQTPEERYKYFAAQLIKPQVSLAILKEYSVLSRQAVININNWVKNSLEFLNHLCRDWNELATVFNSTNPLEEITEISFGAGDSHRGGRSVAILTFKNGLKIVYKPRSLAVDEVFQKLLSWINKKSDHPNLKITKLLNRKNYGWVEYINYQSCDSENEVEKCYLRQGCLLAILYALEATDFHAENLIINGEHPVLIDLEALFHPRPKESRTIHRITSNKIENSVMRTGLLPQKVWIGGSENSEGIDLSGIGGKEGQTMPFPVPQWERINTDEIHLVKKPMLIPGSLNHPQLKKKEVNPLHYRKFVLEGFKKTYYLLTQFRDELLSQDGLISSFADCEIRFIARPTRTYSILLNESFHPDFLRDALDRDRFFERLWVDVEIQPHLERIIKFELQDLNNGDIPYFSTTPASLDIYASNGERILNFLETSGLDLTKKRLAGLSLEDLERQLWFINASFASLSPETDRVLHPKTKTRQNLINSTDPLNIAKKIGDRLICLADRQAKFVSWTGISLMGEKSWSLSPVSYDLFYGLPGIGLFLAYLGKFTGERKYSDFAKYTFETLTAQLNKSSQQNKTIGAFDGLGGLLYLHLQLGALWQDSALICEAEELARKISEQIIEDRAMDVISGAAGAIWALYALHKYKPSEITSRAIRQCGNHLLQQAKPMQQGIGWETSSTKIPLAGLSHGCAGIAYSLLIAYSVCNETMFRDAAFEAMEYERSLFFAEAGNWKDIRETNEPETDSLKFMTAWCHGAPGIGMGRLASMAFLNDRMIEAEIRTAIKTTISTGFGQNHSLCHGDLGNLDFLLQVQQKAGHLFDIQNSVRKISQEIIQSIDDYGWMCGIPLNIETPGFMTGLAGIGYGLLRIWKPDELPSLLIFDSPIEV